MLQLLYSLIRNKWLNPNKFDKVPIISLHDTYFMC